MPPTPKKFSEWAPYYTWLARKGLVEIDKSIPSESGWGTVIEMVGPDFSVKFDDDPFGPLASIGSDALGWTDVVYVVSFIAPKAFPGFPAKFRPDRETQARHLKRNWGKVVKFFRQGDQSQLAAHVERVRQEGMSYRDPSAKATLDMLNRLEAEGDEAILAMNAMFKRALERKE